MSSEPLKLLFLCSRNQWRSPTAEALFRGRDDVQARSAGTAASARRRLNQQTVDWADVIFCMERKHARQLRQRFTLRVPVHTLDIPDDYQRDDPELIELLLEKLTEYLPPGS